MNAIHSDSNSARDQRCRIGWMPALALSMLCFGVLGCATPITNSAAGGGAAKDAAAQQPTLWRFLGVHDLKQEVCAVGSHFRNRLGARFPGLEAKPPLTALTDPSNTEADASTAEQSAAEVKMEQDKAPQKEKAIRFLSSQGCGKCFPKTEQSLLESLEDCTESVRYAAVRGLRNATGSSCQNCRTNSCCTPKLLKKLNEMAYDLDDQGCPVESSARIRRLARVVIKGCGGATVAEESVPDEGPASEDDQVPVPPPAPAEATNEGTDSTQTTSTSTEKDESLPEPSESNAADSESTDASQEDDSDRDESEEGKPAESAVDSAELSEWRPRVASG